MQHEPNKLDGKRPGFTRFDCAFPRPVLHVVRIQRLLTTACYQVAHARFLARAGCVSVDATQFCKGLSCRALRTANSLHVREPRGISLGGGIPALYPS